MKFGVVQFPGTNCDHDTLKAVRGVLGEEAELLWHQSTNLCGSEAVILPGGFAHGDYLRAGAIARFSPIMAAVIRFAETGGTVLGICNGFQVLTEAGLLPGALIRNRGLRFRCRPAVLRVENVQTQFTRACREGELLRIPINHGLGNYCNSPEEIERLEDNGQVLFRYVDNNGQATDEANPNGSANNIAGIMNREGNVLGMMPHPERAVEALLGTVDGLKIFESMRQSAKNHQPVRQM